MTRATHAILAFDTCGTCYLSFAQSNNRTVSKYRQTLYNDFPFLWSPVVAGDLLYPYMCRMLQKKQRIETTRHTRFRQMVLHVIDLYSKLVRAALLPHSLSKLDEQVRGELGVWRLNDTSPAGWLPSCVRCVR